MRTIKVTTVGSGKECGGGRGRGLLPHLSCLPMPNLGLDALPGLPPATQSPHGSCFPAGICSSVSQGEAGLSCVPSDLSFSRTPRPAPHSTSEGTVHREALGKPGAAPTFPPLTSLGPQGLWMNPDKGMGRGQPHCCGGSYGEKRSEGS